MLASQMESTDARRMFPGWDEPAFRATFRLRVTVPKQLRRSVEHAGRRTGRSRATRRSCSSRARRAWRRIWSCCAPASSVTSPARRGSTVVRLVAPKGREQNGRYALDAAEKLLAYYNDYFGIKYPLPKLDLIDVPGGFPGAMENWGGITFTEDTLLFDPAVEPESAKSTIFETIAHEMSHQWFGDLVTMAWWDNLWLNEGFADWMQTKATDHFNPAVASVGARQRRRRVRDADRRPDDDAPRHTPIEDETQADCRLRRDHLPERRRLHPHDGAYLGPDTFRDGIRLYCAARVLATQRRPTCTTALSAVSHQDVAVLPRRGRLDPGFPLVSVSESLRRRHADARRSRNGGSSTSRVKRRRSSGRFRCASRPRPIPTTRTSCF